MSEFWLAWIAVLAGFGGLIWSADRFVAGSAAIANNFGISRLVIGLTIVSLGTSAPEMVVSISAALKGSGELAIGNALGSNITNIGLVLAVTILIAPMPIQPHLIKEELPTLLAVTAAAGFTLYDATVSVLEGILLLGALIPLFHFMIRSKRKHHCPEENTEILAMTNFNASLWFLIGLLALIASSETLVWGAQIIANAFGVSPLIIGLTVIAVGTSLPELATSIMSAIKGHHDMALGNIIGSNIFNILAVMALPGIIQPPHMDAVVFERDFVAMAAITILLASAIVVDYQLRNRRKKQWGAAHLGRVIGSVLLISYIAYYSLLFY